jgi:hypothetical protein
MKDIQIGHLMFEDGETFDVSVFLYSDKTPVTLDDYEKKKEEMMNYYYKVKDSYKALFEEKEMQ